MSKQAKFFCEYCGSEVKGNARFCPGCGKFFSSVKCPKCGKIGNTKDFTNGCPQCGYAEGNDEKNTGSSKTENSVKKRISRIKSKREERYRKRSEDSLPPWVYLVAVMLLIVIIAVFILMF